MNAVNQSIVQPNAGAQPFFTHLLTHDRHGNWVICLPTSLKSYQNELEILLSKVFAGRPFSKENIELAQQLTLNWCLSKCRQTGISFDEYCEHTKS